jgi:hypothetical protein
MLLQAEFFDTRFVRRDRRAFHATPNCLMALAASTVIWSSVSSRFWIDEVVIFQVNVEIGVDQLVLDEAAR